MNPNDYTWKAEIKTGHRVTIPSFIIKDWSLVEGDEVYMTAKRVSKTIADTHTVITEGELK